MFTELSLSSVGVLDSRPLLLFLCGGGHTLTEAFISSTDHLKQTLGTVQRSPLTELPQASL